MKKKFALIGALALTFLTACGEAPPTAEELAAEASARAEIEAALKPDVPVGYTDVGDVAVKWLKKEESEEFSCGHLEACTNLKVYSYFGCPNGVYGKANMKNSSGTVVDWTNDTLASLGAEEYGILVFGSYGSSGYTYSLAELNCR